MTPGVRRPSPHNSRADAHERQRAVLRALGGVPSFNGEAIPLSQDALYILLRYKLTRTEVKSAISCLRTRGLIKLATPPSPNQPGTYQLTDLGLMECGSS